MLRTVIYFFFLFSVCFAEFSLQKLRNNVLNGNVQDGCYSQFRHLDAESFLRMIDSSDLVPSGISNGNFYNLGYYDECLAITNATKKVTTKYCLAAIHIKHTSAMLEASGMEHPRTMIENTKKKFERVVKTKVFGPASHSLVEQLTEYVRLGVCIPSNCNFDRLKEIIPLEPSLTHCYTESTNSEMDTSATIALAVLCFFVLLVILSTIYDIVLEYMMKKNEYPILVAFSFLTNGRRLFKTNSSSDQLGCLNGIKTLSMMWVILGHTYLNMALSASIDNFKEVEHWLDDPKNMLLLSATLSVDTFFTIGGLLTVYVYMKSSQMELHESFKKIPFLYIHRYLRLTPALAMMVYIYASGLLKYVSDGPKWASLNSTIDDCVQNWWSVLIYIQNYKSYTTMCVVQSWYLSAEFQLFLVAPFLLIPLKKWPKYVLPILYGLTIVGMIIPFCIGYTNKASGIGMGSATSVFIDDYYFTTHTRFATYVIGMIAGYYIFKMKSRENIYKFGMGTRIGLWIVCISGLLITVFDGYKLIHESDNEWVDGIYMGLNRSAWSIAMSLLIMLCSTGNGGPLNEFLSLPVFQIIAKLSYSMYLIHYIVILMFNLSARNSIHFTNFFTITQFFIHFTITLGLSVIYCLMFESPVITLEKFILPSRQKGANSESKEKV